MRINRYVSTATGKSRRQADLLIGGGRVQIDGQTASLGSQVDEGQKVKLDDKVLNLPSTYTTVMLNKPPGYVVSRNGQGSLTVYDLLPDQYQSLKPIGRLDKDSSGLLLLTNDGQLAQTLSHPTSHKLKIYEVQLNKPMADSDLARITSTGVKLEDGPSRFDVQTLPNKMYQVKMYEGRNRQIRRTFEALGYSILSLHRTHFGEYKLDNLKPKKYIEI